MGGTNWSTAAYSHNAALRSASGQSAFNYTDTVLRQRALEGRVLEIHPSLDPKKIRMRESRDSDVHPESVAVMIGLDVTASMAHVPRLVQAALPTLMTLLLQYGYLRHPHIMPCAFTDEHADNKAWLQMGQFEAGNEIENDLGNLWLEGGGGGQNKESSDLVLWAAAHKTSIDCFERRQKKGYLFIITDEQTWSHLDRASLQRVFGADNLPENVQQSYTLAELVATAKEKFEIFVLVPTGTGVGGDEVTSFWRRHIGAGQVFTLSDATGVCEVIGAIIGVCEDRLSPEDLDQLQQTHSISAQTAENVRTIVTELAARRAAVPQPSGGIVSI